MGGSGILRAQWGNSKMELGIAKERMRDYCDSRIVEAATGRFFM